MKRNILQLAGAALLLLAGAPVALAQTTAGTQVKNEVTVTYEVGGVGQTDETNDTSFLVDRRVDLVVSESGGAVKNIVPDATPSIANGYYLTYTVTNNSNDIIDIKLDVAQLNGETIFTTLTDNKDSSATPTYSLYIDNEGGGSIGSWDAGDGAVQVDGAQPYLDHVAAGDTMTVFVVTNQFYDDATLDNDDVIGLSLTGTAASAWNDPALPAAVSAEFPTARVADAGNLGADLANDTDGDVAAAVENVFDDPVDIDGSLDAAGNGKDDAYDAFVVQTAAITVTKRSKVYYDPVTLDADDAGEEPKAIPGALVLYCITIANTGDSDAENVVVSDDIPSNTVFVDANTDVAIDVTSANSIRFSTADSCTAADWNGGTAETSDATDGGADNRTGDYNLTTTGAVTTEVPTVVSTSGVTTTMFLVEIQ